MPVAAQVRGRSRRREAGTGPARASSSRRRGIGSGSDRRRCPRRPSSAGGRAHGLCRARARRLSDASRSGSGSPARGCPIEPARTLAGDRAPTRGTRGRRLARQRVPLPGSSDATRAARSSRVPSRCSASCSTRPVANLGVGDRRQRPRRAGAAANRPRRRREPAGRRVRPPRCRNPYLRTFLSPSRASPPSSPPRIRYSLVFDTARPAQRGPFPFRLWIDDVTAAAPCRSRSRTAIGGQIRARVLDAGAGVDPDAIRYRIDNGPWRRDD